MEYAWCEKVWTDQTKRGGEFHSCQRKFSCYPSDIRTFGHRTSYIKETRKASFLPSLSPFLTHPRMANRLKNIFSRKNVKFENFYFRVRNGWVSFFFGGGWYQPWEVVPSGCVIEAKDLVRLPESWKGVQHFLRLNSTVWRMIRWRSCKMGEFQVLRWNCAVELNVQPAKVVPFLRGSFWWTFNAAATVARFQLALGNIMRQQMDRHGVCFFCCWWWLPGNEEVNGVWFFGDLCLTPRTAWRQERDQKKKDKEKGKRSAKTRPGECGPGCCCDVATFWSLTICRIPKGGVSKGRG